MKVILLEKIKKLGSLGETVEVRPGYGRNYLIPQGKAVSATPNNIASFEAEKQKYQQAEQDLLSLNKQRQAKLSNLSVTIAARIGLEGKLFGSVGAVDLANAINTEHPELQVQRAEILLPEGPIRSIGEHEVSLALHNGELTATIKVNIVALEQV